MKTLRGLVLLAAVFLAACSPVNSMAPFDDQQAAIVATSMMPQKSNLTSSSAMQAHGSGNN